MKVVLCLCLTGCALFAQSYEEYFTGGVMQLDWHPWFKDSTGIGDSMQVINDPTTPGGDDWAGKISNAYMGVAGLTFSDPDYLSDYSLEAYIYTVVSPSMGPYNGITMRLDTVTGYYYRLVSDFDDSQRLRLGAYVGSTTPLVIRDWVGGEIPGGVPATSSWHKFRLEMQADLIFAYYDDVMLPDCPFQDNTSAQGYFGVYIFNMLAEDSTKCDNIIVSPVGVEQQSDEYVANLRAYPNPFRDAITITYSAAQSQGNHTVTIYDASGRLVKNLQSTISNQQCILSWDGKDDNGTLTAPGVYFVSNDNVMLKVVKVK